MQKWHHKFKISQDSADLSNQKGSNDQTSNSVKGLSNSIYSDDQLWVIWSRLKWTNEVVFERRTGMHALLHVHNINYTLLNSTVCNNRILFISECGVALIIWTAVLSNAQQLTGARFSLLDLLRSQKEPVADDPAWQSGWRVRSVKPYVSSCQDKWITLFICLPTWDSWIIPHEQINSS